MTLLSNIIIILYSNHKTFKVLYHNNRIIGVFILLVAISWKENINKKEIYCKSKKEMTNIFPNDMQIANKKPIENSQYHSLIYSVVCN